MVVVTQNGGHLNAKNFSFICVIGITVIFIIICAMFTLCSETISTSPQKYQDSFTRVEYILYQDKRKMLELSVSNRTSVISAKTKMPDPKTTTTTPKTQTSTESRKLNNSGTRPPFYPENGTGVTVDMVKQFDPSVFNGFCQNLQLTVIIPVYSAADRFERRTAIRQSYAKTCTSMVEKCKLFFVVGIDKDNSTMEKVKAEYVKEKDMLMIDKIDTYRDLNNKATAMVNWIDQFCSSTKFVLHVIDDTYPNIALFLKFLESFQETNYFLGYNMPGLTPMRDGKWGVSKEEYPYDLYPAYVAGTAYAFPASVIKQLKSAFHTVKYCWIEDVWFTGFVREGAGLKIINLPVHFQEHPERNTNFSNNIFYHNVKVEDFYYFYNVSTKQVS